LTLPGQPNQGTTAKASGSTSANRPIADSLAFEFSKKSPHSQRISQKATIKFKPPNLEVVTPKNYLSINNLEIIPPKNYVETIFGIFLSTTNTRHNPELNSRLEKLLLEKRKDEIINVLKIINNDIRDIIIGVNNMIYLDTGLQTYVPSNIMGGGFKRLLSVITTIYFNKGGVVLIDEIENGFHYKTFSPLWSAMIKAAKVFNVQLFVSTHNLEVLKQLKNVLDSDNELFSQGDDVKAYTLVRSESNAITAIEFDHTQFSHAIEREIEIR
jgi:AAA15 family ATPase/GTPase